MNCHKFEQDISCDLFTSSTAKSTEESILLLIWIFVGCLTSAGICVWGGWWFWAPCYCVGRGWWKQHQRSSQFEQFISLFLFEQNWFGSHSALTWLSSNLPSHQMMMLPNQWWRKLRRRTDSIARQQPWILLRLQLGAISLLLVLLSVGPSADQPSSSMTKALPSVWLVRCRVHMSFGLHSGSNVVGVV